ncbi:MAG: radical SAM protein [Atribacterota bacterium]|nr:radical SAM protein [Atribacterota bacterium]
MNILRGNKKYPSITTIGIGLTNLCNLNCDHCYSRKMTERSFSLEDAKKTISAFPFLKSVNFGTGESVLNNQFEEIVNLFYSKNIKLAVTSNGLTVNKMKEETLIKFDDVDISIDFPERELHDQWRKKNGLFDNAIKAIERCNKFNINVSIVSVLMSNNHDYFQGFKPILDKYDVNLRINLYKAVNKDEFTPSYGQFWEAIKIISENFEVVTCSEPILSLFWDETTGGSKCGSSMRIHPDGNISSCVYVRGDSSHEKFNADKKILPEFCKSCLVFQRCVGGCYGRRVLENRQKLPDLYCPYFNKKKLPAIKFKKYKKAMELIHSNYLCTIILR